MDPGSRLAIVCHHLTRLLAFSRGAARLGLPSRSTVMPTPHFICISAAICSTVFYKVCLTAFFALPSFPQLRDFVLALLFRVGQFWLAALPHAWFVWSTFSCYSGLRTRGDLLLEHGYTAVDLHRNVFVGPHPLPSVYSRGQFWDGATDFAAHVPSTTLRPDLHSLPT